MRKVFLSIHPTNFSLFGGTLLGTAFGGIISILSNSTLEDRWFFLFIACSLFSFSGVLFNILSVIISDIQVSIGSILRISSSSKTREELDLEFYKQNKRKLNYVFFTSIIFLSIGLLCLVLGPFNNILFKNCG